MMGKIVDISEVILELGLSSSITEEERAVIYSSITRAEGSVKRFLCYDPIRLTRTEYYPQQTSFHSGYAVWETDEIKAYMRHISNASTNELQVKHIPIRSITGLYIDYDGRSGAKSGAFAVSTLKTEGTDFWPNYDGLDSSNNKICRDGIIKSVGAWPTESGSVKITYIAGYTDAELHGQDNIVDASPIATAVIDEAVIRAKKALMWQKKNGIGFIPGVVTGEKMGDYSYTIDTAMAQKLFGGQWDLSGSSVMLLQPFVHWGINT